MVSGLGRGELMIRILLAFMAAASLLACPVLLLMDQLYVAACLGVIGIALAVALLVSAGENRK